MEELLDTTFEHVTIFGRDDFRNRYVQLEVKEAVFDFRIYSISKSKLFIEYTELGKRKRIAEPIDKYVICDGINLPKLKPLYPKRKKISYEESENIFTQYLEENYLNILIDGRYTQTVFEVDNTKAVQEWRDSLQQNKPEPLVEITHPEEIENQSKLLEGSVISKLVNYYERNPSAREKCIEHFGFECKACNLNIEKKYGEIGKNFIHVHHITPLSKINEKYEVDPRNDLIPLCPNCHSMIHKKNPPYTLEQLKKIITKNNGYQEY